MDQTAIAQTVLMRSVGCAQQCTNVYVCGAVRTRVWCAVRMIEVSTHGCRISVRLAKIHPHGLRLAALVLLAGWFVRVSARRMLYLFALMHGRKPADLPLARSP